MNERLVTFANFRMGVDDVALIGAKRDSEGRLGLGVGEQMKTAFGFEGGWRDLTAVMAPHRELQSNIEFMKHTLSDPEVQRRLGKEDQTAAQIARGWVIDSELQEGVLRSLIDPGHPIPGGFDVGEQPERVTGWADRMGDTAIIMGRSYRIGRMVLTTAEREIGPNENPEVAAGTPSSRYMEETIKPRLVHGRTRKETAEAEAQGASLPSQSVFGRVEVLKTGKNKGDEAMVEAARMLKKVYGVDLATAKIVVFSVAGNWIQSGMQARNGFQSIEEGFDTNPENRQLFVACEPFPVGETGDEPKTTHQNPFSASGNITRSFIFLDDQKSHS